MPSARTWDTRATVMAVSGGQTCGTNFGSKAATDYGNAEHAVNVLVIDIGGTNVKFMCSGQDTPRRFPSGRDLTPDRMTAGVKAAAAAWGFDVVSIGYPGPILCGQPMTEPVNLGPGWMGFDFAAAFGCPVKLINDAAMQALGSYRGGKMLFLGLGTGVGAAVIHDGELEPLEVGRLHYKKRTLEHYIGARGRKRQGQKKWQKQVEEAVARFVRVLKPDDVVLGGGNAKKLKPLPAGTRLGDNALAFVGGRRMWEPDETLRPASDTEVGNGQTRETKSPRQFHAPAGLKTGPAVR